MIEYIKNVDQAGPFEFWEDGERLDYDEGFRLATKYTMRRQKEIAAEDNQLVE